MLTLEKINKIKDPIKRRKLKEDLVNADEAAAIDMYGSVGENVVKSVGSGTINPDTGIPYRD